MKDTAMPIIDMDWNAFDPWRIQPFKHALTDHPLLQTEQLVELGKRCQKLEHGVSEERKIDHT